MGYAFVQAAGSFQCNLAVWEALLKLASQYGWQPAGTLAPPEAAHSPWEGGYIVTSGQWVTDADAHAMATAVAVAYADLPDDDALPSDVTAWVRAGGAQMFAEWDAVARRSQVMQVERAVPDASPGLLFAVSQDPMANEAIIDFVGRAPEARPVVCVARWPLVRVVVPGGQLSTRQFFSGPRKAIVLAFIEFARAGGFRIW